MDGLNRVLQSSALIKMSAFSLTALTVIYQAVYILCLAEVEGIINLFSVCNLRPIRIICTVKYLWQFSTIIIVCLLERVLLL